MLHKAMTRLLVPVVLFASVACAQNIDIGVYGGSASVQKGEIGSFTDNLGQVTRVNIDNGWKFGFRVSFIPESFLGYEAGYGYNRLKIDFAGSRETQSVHQGYFAANLYLLPSRSPVRPFVSGGGHFSNFIFPGQGALQGAGENKFGVNYGAGVRVRVGERYSVRLDVKQYLQGKPFTQYFRGDGTLLINEVSAGFNWVF